MAKINRINNMAEALLSKNSIDAFTPLSKKLVFDETGRTVSFIPANITEMHNIGFAILEITIASAYTFSNTTATYCINGATSYIAYGEPSYFSVGSVVYRGLILTTIVSADHPTGSYTHFLHGTAVSTFSNESFYVKVAPGYGTATASNGTINVKCWKIS